MHRSQPSHDQREHAVNRHFVPLMIAGLLTVSTGSCGKTEKSAAIASEQLAEGKKLIEIQAWLQAIECFNKAIENDDEMMEAYLLRATAMNEYLYITQGSRQPAKFSREDAARDAYRVLQKIPESGEAHLQRGYAFAGLADVAEAEKAFSKAIDYLSNPTQAYVERAALLFHQGRYSAAEDDLTAAIELNPLNAEYYEARAMYARFARHFKTQRIDQAKAATIRKRPNVTLEELHALEQDVGDYEPISIAANNPEVIVEAERLRGKWKVVVNEVASGATDTTDRNYSVTFRGDQYIWILDGEVQQKNEFRLDPSKSPCHLDLFGKLRGNDAIFLAIYELQGNTMRLCLAHPGEARPSDFTTKDNHERSLYTMKRIVGSGCDGPTEE